MHLRMERLRPQHVTALFVAGVCILLALLNGGFDPSTYGAGTIAAWAFVLGGLALGLVPRAEPPRNAVITGLFLAAFAALIALSMLWGSDNGEAYEDVIRALFYLAIFVVVVLAAARGDAVAWLSGLAIGLVAVAVIALGARFEQSFFGHPDADIASSLPAALGRLTYPVGYWNGLAAAMASALTLLAWLGSSSKTTAARCAATAAIVPVLLALWMTGSRGGLIAAAIGVAVILVFSRRRTPTLAGLGLGILAAAVAILVVEGYDELRTDPLAPASAGQGDRMLLITLALIAATAAARAWLDGRIQGWRISSRAGRAVLIAAGVAIVATVALSDPVQRWDDFKEPPTISDLSGGVSQLRIGGSGRYQFWEQAVDAFASDPVAGVGSAGYTSYWLEHRDIAIPATRAHSLIFETMAELGLVGLALIIGFFASTAVTGIRRARNGPMRESVAASLGLLAVGFATSAVDWTWDLPAVFVPTIVAAGLLTGPATLARFTATSPASGGEVRSRRRFSAGVALLIVAWVSVCAAGLLLLADRRLEASREAFDRGDLQAAANAAEDAASIEPWAAEPHTQLALIRERGGQIDEARQEIEEAIDRAPRDYKLYLLATRLETEAGDRVAASASFARAVQLNPKDPTLATLVAR
jgi:O-antigen ligase